MVEGESDRVLLEEFALLVAEVYSSKEDPSSPERGITHMRKDIPSFPKRFAKGGEGLLKIGKTAEISLVAG